MREYSKVPKIRFPEYKDNWEERKISEIFTERHVLSKISEEYPRLSFTIEEGVISPEDRKTNKRDFLMKDEANKKFLLTEEGDIIYNPANVVFGAIHRNSYGKGCLSPIYKIFTTEQDSRFMECVVRADSFIKTLSQKTEGTVVKLKTLKPEAFMEMVVNISPSLDEQKDIAEFFFMIDKLIDLYQRKSEDIKSIKKYLLQKMFPQNGEKVPEIRFPGFTEVWEQRKLGELCERVTRKNKNNESDLPLTIASQYGLIDQRDFFNKVVAAKDMSNYYLLRKGEFAYNKSYSNGFDYGSIKRLNAYEQGCLSTLYICFGITSDEIESDYLECYFDTLKWYSDITMICAEGARNHGLLNVDTKAFFDEVTIYMPSSKEEQRMISVILNNLDNLINLHQSKCEELKMLRKGLHQKMFIQ